MVLKSISSKKKSRCLGCEMADFIISDLQWSFLLVLNDFAAAKFFLEAE